MKNTFFLVFSLFFLVITLFSVSAEIIIVKPSSGVLGNQSEFNVNSSDFWDLLDDPSDISTGDLIDDNTYVQIIGDTMSGSLTLSGAGSNLLHTVDLDLFPDNQATIGLRIGQDGTNLELTALGTNTIIFSDDLNISEFDLISVGNITHDDSTASDWFLRQKDIDKKIYIEMTGSGPGVFNALELDSNGNWVFGETVTLDSMASTFSTTDAQFEFITHVLVNQFSTKGGAPVSNFDAAAVFSADVDIDNNADIQIYPGSKLKFNFDHIIFSAEGTGNNDLRIAGWGGPVSENFIISSFDTIQLSANDDIQIPSGVALKFNIDHIIFNNSGDNMIVKGFGGPTGHFNFTGWDFVNIDTNLSVEDTITALNWSNVTIKAGQVQGIVHSVNGTNINVLDIEGDDLLIAETNNGGATDITVRNTQGTNSDDEEVCFVAQQVGGVAGGKICMAREGLYISGLFEDSSMNFYTTTNGIDTLALKIDESQNFNFQGGDFSNIGALNIATLGITLDDGVGKGLITKDAQKGNFMMFRNDAPCATSGFTWTLDNFGKRIFWNCTANTMIYEQSTNLQMNGGNFSANIGNFSGNLTGNLIYGEMFCDDCQVEVNLQTQDVFVSITNLTTGKLNGFTFENDTLSNNATLTALVSGLYKVDYSISYFASRQDNYETGVAINGVNQDNTESHRKVGSINDIGNVGGTGLVVMNAGDNLTIQIKDEDTPVGDVTIDHINLIALRIGDIL